MRLGNQPVSQTNFLLSRRLLVNCAGGKKTIAKGFSAHDIEGRIEEHVADTLRIWRSEVREIVVKGALPVVTSRRDPGVNSVAQCVSRTICPEQTDRKIASAFSMSGRRYNTQKQHDIERP